jgi:3-dehydroquinate synthase
MNRSVLLKHRSGKTRIEIGWGLIKGNAPHSLFGNQRGKFLVVTNRRVKSLVCNQLIAKFENTKDYAGTVLIPDSESAKSIENAQKLYDKLISIGFDRSSHLLAIGGGVCSDLTGFVASTFMRGIEWSVIPTTLLAQIDAAIGGKTAINHRLGKNLIGTFHHPKHVLIDPEVLTTLGETQYCSGIAEMIKYGMIADPQLLRFLESNQVNTSAGSLKSMEKMIARCVRIKARIVENDELDQNKRLVLNFGHTFGHALESEGLYKNEDHGKAVAVGMLFATHMAVKTGLCQESVFKRLKALLDRYALSPAKRKFDKKRMAKAMATDKKRKGDILQFVLPERVGRVVIKDIPVKILTKDAFWTFNQGYGG